MILKLYKREDFFWGVQFEKSSTPCTHSGVVVWWFSSALSFSTTKSFWPMKEQLGGFSTASNLYPPPPASLWGTKLLMELFPNLRSTEASKRKLLWESQNSEEPTLNFWAGNFQTKPYQTTYYLVYHSGSIFFNPKKCYQQLFDELGIFSGFIYIIINVVNSIYFWVHFFIVQNGSYFIPIWAKGRARTIKNRWPKSTLAEFGKYVLNQNV